MGLWQKIEYGAAADPPAYLDNSDNCYYAYDYVSGGTFKDGPGNDLIKNFQKSVSVKGTNQWKYKLGAIDKVGRIIAATFADVAHIAPMPTSKTEGCPDYDDRLIQALRIAQTHNSKLVIHYPISRRIRGIAAKSGAGSRHPSLIESELQWRGFSGPAPAGLYLFDDVITSGGHFKACAQLVSANSPGTSVAGIFIAKTKWTKPDGSEFETAADTSPNRD